MARFHGQVTGSRQPATRVGTQESGISAVLKSGSRDVIESRVDASIAGPTAGEEVVHLEITHLRRKVLDVELNASHVADAMNYDPDVRFHLQVIESEFRRLTEAATAAHKRRVELALRANQGRS